MSQREFKRIAKAILALYQEGYSEETVASVLQDEFRRVREAEPAQLPEKPAKVDEVMHLNTQAVWDAVSQTPLGSLARRQYQEMRSRFVWLTTMLADKLPLPKWMISALAAHPLGTTYEIEHDGFKGSVIGYYERADGKRGVVLQQQGTNVVHVYGDKWLKS